MPKAHFLKSPNQANPDGFLSPSLRRDLVKDRWKFLCFVLAAAAIIQAWDAGRQVACMDYYQFWTVGQIIRERRSENIYSPSERQRLGEMMWLKVEARVGTDENARGASKQYQAGVVRQNLETYSTPFLYALFGISSTEDYDRDQDRFQLFSLFCLVFGVALLCRVAGYSPAAGAVAVAFSLAAFGPTVSDASVGNVNRVQIALVALFIWLLGAARRPARHFLAGIVLGIAMLFKPNLLFVGMTVASGWAFSKQYGKLLWGCAGMAAGVLAGFTFSAAYGGSWRLWLEWSAEMPRLMSEYDAPVRKGNFALSKVIEESVGLDAALVISLAILAGVIFVLWRSGDAKMRDSSSVADLRLAALGCLVSLLAVSLAWLHYYVLTIVSILYLLRPMRRAEGAGELREHPAKLALALSATVMVAANSSRIPAALQPDISTLALTTGSGALLSLGLILFEFPLRRYFPRRYAQR